MQFILQENPLATKILLSQTDYEYLTTSVETERDEENKWAMEVYGMPYEYEHSVESEVQTLTSHLKGIKAIYGTLLCSHLFCITGIHDGACVRVAKECLKCTGERHLGLRTWVTCSNTTPWHIKTAMEDCQGDLRKAITYLESFSNDWDGNLILSLSFITEMLSQESKQLYYSATNISRNGLHAAF